MADDITNGELARRLDDLRHMLADLVGRPEYQADQRGTDRRLLDLERDLESLQQQHAKDNEAVYRHIAEQVKAAAERHQSWRTIVYTGLIPAAVVLIGILVQLLLAHSGGGK